MPRYYLRREGSLYIVRASRTDAPVATYENREQAIEAVRMANQAVAA